MKFNRASYALLLATLLAPAVFALSTQSTPPLSWQLTKSEVRALERAQPTAESCEKLAHYYRGRAANYREQAQVMDAILAQRETTAQTAGGKYAQSVDSGRRLDAYYLQMAQEMDSRAESWDEKRQHLQ